MRVLALTCVAGLAMAALAPVASAKTAPEWHMNATAIEACSCPMFCTCYFGGGHPAAHHDMAIMAEEHYCRFNNAYKINAGNYKGTKLDGAKFWLSGDLGGDFTQGQMDWVVVTFDKATTQAQRDAIGAIAAQLFPVKWKSMTTAVGDIAWNATKDGAHATLDGGQTAEVQLEKGGFGQAGQVPVIKGLQYWGSDSNTGFVLMPNLIDAYRVGDKKFEYKGSNGFMLTLDISAKPATTGSKSGM